MGATKKQRDELLEFIRHLAEDDKEGVMAVKVSKNESVVTGHIKLYTCQYDEEGY